MQAGKCQRRAALSSTKLRSAQYSVALRARARAHTHTHTHTRARARPEKWHRVSVVIKCVGDGSDEKNKGELRTYVDGEPLATVKRKELSTNSRFALTDKFLYLFSSGKSDLMSAQVRYYD